MPRRPTIGDAETPPSPPPPPPPPPVLPLPGLPTVCMALARAAASLCRNAVFPDDEPLSSPFPTPAPAPYPFPDDSRDPASRDVPLSAAPAAALPSEVLATAAPLPSSADPPYSGGASSLLPSCTLPCSPACSARGADAPPASSPALFLFFSSSAVTMRRDASASCALP